MIGRAPPTRLSWEAEVALAAAPLFTGELIYVQLVSPLMWFGLSLLPSLDDETLPFWGAAKVAHRPVELWARSADSARGWRCSYHHCFIHRGPLWCPINENNSPLSLFLKADEDLKRKKKKSLQHLSPAKTCQRVALRWGGTQAHIWCSTFAPSLCLHLTTKAEIRERPFNSSFQLGHHFHLNSSVSYHCGRKRKTQQAALNVEWTTHRWSPLARTVFFCYSLRLSWIG